MQRMPGAGFVFDCDGTLLDTMDAWLSMEDAFAQRAGGCIDAAMREKLDNQWSMPKTKLWGKLMQTLSLECDGTRHSAWEHRRKRSNAK